MGVLVLVIWVLGRERVGLAGLEWYVEESKKHFRNFITLACLEQV